MTKVGEVYKAEDGTKIDAHWNEKTQKNEFNIRSHRNTILFDESAAQFVCEALGIEGVDPKDVVLIRKNKVITKQDGILKLIDAFEETMRYPLERDFVKCACGSDDIVENMGMAEATVMVRCLKCKLQSDDCYYDSELEDAWKRAVSKK